MSGQGCRGSVAGALRQASSWPAQIPADKLTNHASAVMADRLGGWSEVVPQVLLKPDTSDLVRHLARHRRRSYVPYVRCGHSDTLNSSGVQGETHSCIVCLLYVRFKSLSSAEPRDTPLPQ